MSLPVRLRIHERSPFLASAPDPDHHRPETEHLDAVIDGLQERELLEPVLLLSAGYVALPFLLRQGRLLLAPLLALCGFVIVREEGGRALSN